MIFSAHRPSLSTCLRISRKHCSRDFFFNRSRWSLRRNRHFSPLRQDITFRFFSNKCPTPEMRLHPFVDGIVILRDFMKLVEGIRLDE